MKRDCAGTAGRHLPAAKTTDTTETDTARSEAAVLAWAERLFLGASACILAVELWYLISLVDG